MTRLTAAGHPARPRRTSRAMPKPKTRAPKPPATNPTQPPAATGTDCKVSWSDDRGHWTRCPEPARAEGYCPTHYRRWLRGREQGKTEAALLAYVHQPPRPRGKGPGPTASKGYLLTVTPARRERLEAIARERGYPSGRAMLQRMADELADGEPGIGKPVAGGAAKPSKP